MRDFSIIITGDEVLNCTVSDENGFWLCREMNSMGFYTRELLYLRDDVPLISSHIRRMISSGMDIIIITGGLGPTYDDRTLEAIADATGRKLELNAEAMDMVKARYEKLKEIGIVNSSEMNEKRRKMAIIPAGSLPIKNRTGAAPGIFLRERDTIIIALPGVPSEMRSMFTEEVKKIIEKELGAWVYAERNIVLDYRDESSIAALLEEISKKYGIYVKSRAGEFRNERRMVITLATRSENDKIAVEKLNDAMQELFRHLEMMGIKFTTI